MDNGHLQSSYPLITPLANSLVSGLRVAWLGYWRFDMEHEIDPVAAMRIEDDGGQWVTIHNCRTCGVLVMDHLVDTHRAFFAGVKGQQAVFTPGMVEERL